MRNVLALLTVTSVLFAKHPLDQSSTLAAERFKLTAEFAKAQGDLRQSKDQAGKENAMRKLEEISSSAQDIIDKLVQANASVIQALDSPPDNVYGTYDPSATISSTVTKLTKDNQALSSIKLPTSAPFSPADINTIQVVLDRIKKSIDEHRHACANLETTISQRRRKPIEPPKNYPGGGYAPYRSTRPVR